jgi:hypothetical protein
MLFVFINKFICGQYYLGMTMIGIYEITHIDSGKIYVGQTINSKARWWSHGSLGSGCKKLRNAIQKHGKHRFVFSMIEILDGDVNSQDFLNLLTEREQHFLDLLQPFDDNGYNLSRVATPGGYNKGVPKAGKTARGVGNIRNKVVQQYSIEGELLNTFFSIDEAVKRTNISRVSISQCLTKRNRHARGFLWFYENEPFTPMRIKKSGAHPCSEKTKQLISHANKGSSHPRFGLPATNRKAVIMLSKEGIFYDNLIVEKWRRKSQAYIHHVSIKCVMV